MIIETLSPTIGEDNDGMIIGRFLESGFKRVLTDSHLAGNVYVYLKQKTSTGFSFREYTKTQVSAGINPFGLTGEMSVGDEIGVACDNDSVATYFKMSAASWVGTIEARYSSDGIKANVLLTNVVDNTSRFTQAGTFGITYTTPTNEVAWSPAPEEITSRKWKVFRISAFTSAATAPAISGVEVQHPVSLAKYIEILGAHVTNPAPPETTSTFFPLLESSVWYCVENPIFELINYVYKKSANVRTRVLEYESAANVFTSFANYGDPSADFTNGPTAYITTPIRYIATFTKPSGWIRTTKTFTKIDNTTVTETGYWFRKRTTAVSIYGPTDPATVAITNKQSGADTTTGILFSDDSSTQIKGVTFLEPLLISGSGIIMLNLINLTTGAIAAISFPETPVFPLNIDINDFTPAANDKIGLKYTSGTRIYEDTPIIIHSKINGF